MGQSESRTTEIETGKHDQPIENVPKEEVCSHSQNENISIDSSCSDGRANQRHEEVLFETAFKEASGNTFECISAEPEVHYPTLSNTKTFSSRDSAKVMVNKSIAEAVNKNKTYMALEKSAAAPVIKNKSDGNTALNLSNEAQSVNIPKEGKVNAANLTFSGKMNGEPNQKPTRPRDFAVLPVVRKKITGLEEKTDAAKQKTTDNEIKTCTQCKNTKKLVRPLSTVAFSKRPNSPNRIKYSASDSNLCKSESKPVEFKCEYDLKNSLEKLSINGPNKPLIPNQVSKNGYVDVQDNILIKYNESKKEKQAKGKLKHVIEKNHGQPPTFLNWSEEPQRNISEPAKDEKCIEPNFKAKYPSANRRGKCHPYQYQRGKTYSQFTSPPHFRPEISFDDHSKGGNSSQCEHFSNENENKSQGKKFQKYFRGTYRRGNFRNNGQQEKYSGYTNIENQEETSTGSEKSKPLKSDVLPSPVESSQGCVNPRGQMLHQKNFRSQRNLSPSSDQARGQTIDDENDATSVKFNSSKSHIKNSKSPQRVERQVHSEERPLYDGREDGRSFPANYRGKGRQWQHKNSPWLHPPQNFSYEYQNWPADYQERSISYGMDTGPHHRTEQKSGYSSNKASRGQGNGFGQFLSNELCSICMKFIGPAGYVTLDCMHRLHNQCAFSLAKVMAVPCCPVCYKKPH